MVSKMTHKDPLSCGWTGVGEGEIRKLAGDPDISGYTRERASFKAAQSGKVKVLWNGNKLLVAP